MEPLGCPPEVQLLGNRDEIGQLPQFHSADGTGASSEGVALTDRPRLPVFGKKSWIKNEYRRTRGVRCLVAFGSVRVAKAVSLVANLRRILPFETRRLSAGVRERTEADGATDIDRDSR